MYPYNSYNCVLYLREREQNWQNTHTRDQLLSRMQIHFYKNINFIENAKWLSLAEHEYT